MAQERLNKYLSSTMGICSRRQADQWIEAGYVFVQKKRAKIGQMIDPDTEMIRIQHPELNRDELKRLNKKLASSHDQSAPHVYWLLNKPIKTLCSRRSQGGKKTIFDLPTLAKIPFLVNSVGRLDYLSEGLLLLSNDGDFIQKVSHPSYEINRTYHVFCSRKLEADELALFKKKHFELDGENLKDIYVSFLGGEKFPTLSGMQKGGWYRIQLHIGEKHIVRRIFQSFDKLKVKRLIRVAIGPLALTDSLKPGEYRQLNSKEIQALKGPGKKRDSSIYNQA